jgi:hypothetical protein
MLLVLASACSIGRVRREQLTQEWIATAQKPIQVIQHSSWDHFAATSGNHYYTLIDKSGKIHLAKGVRFQLPAVIE